MTVTTDAAVLEYTSTSAQIRAWAAAVEALVVAAGFVRATVPGYTQPVLSALTHPGATFTAAGTAVVYRLNDALQASAPVFMAFTYGTGATANTPDIYVQFGYGVPSPYNGVEQLIGEADPGNSHNLHLAPSVAPVSGAVNPGFAVALAGVAAVALGHMGLIANTGKLQGLVVERWRDPDGTPNALGWSYAAGFNSLVRSGHYDVTQRKFRAGAVDALETAQNVLGQTSAMRGVRVGVFPWHPDLAYYSAPISLTSPGLSLLTHFTPDLAPGITFTVIRRGVARTYKSLGFSHLAWSAGGSIGAFAPSIGAVIYE